MSGGGSRFGKTPHKAAAPLGSSSLVTPSNKSSLAYAADTPNLSTNYIEKSRYTPAHFTLAKNADLHMDNRPDAFSPATIRMTNSLEAILTDDDDYVEARDEAKQRLAAQQQQVQKQVMTPNRKFIPSNNNLYPETTQGLSYNSTQDDIGITQFRRIQSAGSNSDDEEIDEMKDLNVSSDLGDVDSLEEAEISMINDEEDDDDDDEDGPSVRFGSGPDTSSSIVSASSSGAFQPTKRIVQPTTTTPKPQRSMPRHATGPTYAPASGPGHQYANQSQGRGGYYQQPQQPGYFGQPQHSAPNMFQQPLPPQHYQYSQPHQYSHPQQHYSQPPSFHLPAIIDSPVNQMPHPTGALSPLTIPTDYGQGHGGAYPPQGGSYPHQMQGGDHWRGGGAPVMHQPHGGMGMMPLAGHASPVPFHEMSGSLSPLNLPHYPSYPGPSGNYPQQQRGNNYPQQQTQQQQGGVPRSRTKSTESEGSRRVLSPASASFSPTRTRKDSSMSEQSFNQSVSSPTSSVTASILKQGLPGVSTSTSSDGGEHKDWFYNPSSQKSNLSYSTMESGGGSGSFAKQQQQGSTNKSSLLSLTAVSSLAERRRDPRLDNKPSGSTIHPYNNNVKQQPRDDFVMESPTERQAFKEFGKQFRLREAESLDAARDFALACLDPNNRDVFLPPATHWRVYLELADVAKRSNKIDEARRNYKNASRKQPRASQGWLEHSKLEEESGNLRQCALILQEGLKHCTTNENLLIRSVKFYERVGRLDDARQLLSRLKYVSVDKAWKTMLEGALLEARAGRYKMAREVLKFLTFNVPWYGPLYLAHTKLENDFGSPTEAFIIVEKGLRELPRYGPLYFQAFRLLEKDDLSRKKYDLPQTMRMVRRADNISRELLWKVHLEAAQMQERAAMLAVENSSKKVDVRTLLKPTRGSYAKAIMLCPPNLSWKVWLAAGRTEVSCGNTKIARELFLRAHESVSEKGRSTVILECARLEEYCGDLSLSRSLLCTAREQFGKSDWKVWLASVNLECRCGLQERAIKFAQEALNLHRGTGRLWAALIQLRQDDGELFQVRILKCALRAVPKSGEVWCEGARIYLNPFSSSFDLQSAARCLSFAARFTPQYGDSFLEQLRLDMIGQWLIPFATPFINKMYEEFLSSNRMEMNDAYQFISEHTQKAAGVMKTQLKEGETTVPKDVLDTSELELRCSSADPNYGHLWFKYRGSSIDTAREVIRSTKTLMADSVIEYSYVYVAAMVRRAGVLMIINHQAEKIITDQGTKRQAPRPNSRSWDVLVDKQLRSVPNLDKMISVTAEEISSFGETVGDKSLNKWTSLSLPEKRMVLFGSDSILT